MPTKDWNSKEQKRLNDLRLAHYEKLLAFLYGKVYGNADEIIRLIDSYQEQRTMADKYYDKRFTTFRKLK